MKLLLRLVLLKLLFLLLLQLPLLMPLGQPTLFFVTIGTIAVSVVDAVRAILHVFHTDYAVAHQVQPSPPHLYKSTPIFCLNEGAFDKIPTHNHKSGKLHSISSFVRRSCSDAHEILAGHAMNYTQSPGCNILIGQKTSRHSESFPERISNEALT